MDELNELTHERIDGDEWTGPAVFLREMALSADVVDVFLLLDPREITATVLDHRQVDFPTAVAALDSWFGEIADPYADEDGQA
ncbi:hypothetical protein [Streptomyces griseorubiginosus]|uniref:hypothetical protein n=1 Tax=Streptomyces griseorubiginosus TaxID=67304 RepID=UPI00331B0C89